MEKSRDYYDYFNEDGTRKANPHLVDGCPPNETSLAPALWWSMRQRDIAFALLSEIEKRKTGKVPADEMVRLNFQSA